MADLTPEGWPQFAEVFARRNLFVHRDGLVDRKYTARINQIHYEHDQNLAIGRRVGLDSAYIEKAISSLLIVGICLTDSLYENLDRNSRENRDSDLWSLIGNAMDISDWIFVKHVSNYMLRRTCSAENLRLVCQINYWLACKRMGGYASIKDELTAFDTSVCRPRYVLVVNSLRDNPDEFFRILPMAVASGVKREELTSWAALAEMRQDDRFDEAIESLFAQKTSLALQGGIKNETVEPCKEESSGDQATDAEKSSST